MDSRVSKKKLIALGQRYLSQGQTQIAYDTFLQVERMGGRSQALYIGLGKAASALRDATSAEGWWAKALASGPLRAECYLGLGTSQYHQQKITQAIGSYRRALEIDPEMEGARVSLSIAYLAAECPAQALTHAEECLSRSPDNTDLLLVRATALIKLDRHSEGVDDLAKLLEMGARLGQVGLLECEVNRARKDFEAALILAAEICEAFPTHGAPLRCFRETFEEFLVSAPADRINAFLAGLGLPLSAARPTSVCMSAAKSPEISKIDVIIPVHDGLDYLKACLESLETHRTPILGQIILVDDCSTRETRTWMREMIRHRPDIRLVQKRKQSGFTKSLAAGLSRSGAERFVSLNSDCVVSKGWLEKLSSAMSPQGSVAMVGPLSNNAAWQSLGEIFDSHGNYASSPMPSAESAARIQRRLDLIKVFEATETPLVHGFCVLVDRGIYDALGGLDLETFAQGYGEFQDLSLRALDEGYLLRIADDCYIGHARAGSISGLQRAELSQDARRALYKRYTALRYLSAECSAATNRQVAFTRRRFETLERYCPGEFAAVETPAEITCFGDISADLTGRRVCVFVCYAPDGGILPYTLHYLKSLRTQGFEVVLVMNIEVAHSPPTEALGLVRILILRDNVGFDFGGWRDAMARFPSLWDADILLFTNDSIIGPFEGFDRVARRIEETSAPLFYLTESDFAVSHFQSFFWGFKGAALKDPVIRRFFSSIEDFTSKSVSIFLYEVFFRQVCEILAGVESLCLFPLNDLSGVDSNIRPTFNPTHHLWRELLKSGFPFLKADFCRKNLTGPDAAIWLKEIEVRGGDPMLARLHVEETFIQRSSR